MSVGGRAHLFNLVAQQPFFLFHLLPPSARLNLNRADRPSAWRFFFLYSYLPLSVFLSSWPTPETRADAGLLGQWLVLFLANSIASLLYFSASKLGSREARLAHVG